MRPWKSICKSGARFCLSCLCSFLLWGFWTVMGVMLLAQVWIACHHELNIPSPLLRILETHISPPGLKVKLGKVVFDPSGQLVVRDYAVVLASFDEPLLKGRLLHTRLDPWGMIVGDPKAHQLELSGVELYIPAPLSPSGKTEACVRDLEAVILHKPREIVISQLNARCAGIALAAHGSVSTNAWKQAPSFAGGFSWDDAISRILTTLRQVSTLYPKLSSIEGTSIDLNLTPSESRGAIAQVSLTADGLRLPPPIECEVGPFRVSGRFPIAGNSPVMTRVEASIASIKSPLGQASGIQASVRGVLRPAAFSFDPREADVSAAQVQARGFTARSPSIRIESTTNPQVKFSLVASLTDTPVSIRGTANIAERSGKLRVEFRPTPALIDFAAAYSGKDLAKYISLGEPALIEADIALGPNAKLDKARVWLVARNLEAYHVGIQHVEGQIDWDGQHFAATRTLLRAGNNIARGSYTMDATTRDYRFLLAGHLYPLDIQSWFKEWWPKVFHNFEFRGKAPEADVDIIGRWGTPELYKVFVGVDAENADICTVHFDRARTQMYFFSNFTHVLWLHAFRPEGEAQGWFTRSYNADAGAWQQIDFDVHSTTNPHEVAKIFPPFGPEIVEPFLFGKAPKIHGRGRIEGPGAPKGPSHTVDIEMDAPGTFQLQGFPVSDVICNAHWEDDLLDLSGIHARFAQGNVEGKAKITLKESDKRIRFEGTLKGAKLGEAMAIVEAYNAKQDGKPPASAASKTSGIEKVMDSKLDLDVSAEGPYKSPLRFTGTGNALISGGELGQLRMLGLLSELFRFTTLRFTTVKAQFNLAGNDIQFPSVRVFGNSSAIEMHGNYSLEKKTLDFNAKVWPFDEHPSLVQGAIGLVLSPFSHVFEVKLRGTPSNPSWSFANNPFRFLGRSADESATATDAQKAAETAPTEKPATNSSSETQTPVQPTEEKK